MISEILEKLCDKNDLRRDTAFETMLAIMNGEWTSAQIAALLVAMKIKGETVEELTGFVSAMRDRALTIASPENTIDTCGTGGDGASTFNISTISAVIAAAAGIPVAKHGNRSVSSLCGSADVLQELGVNVNLTPEQAENCLRDIGIAFLFAPVYHRSMKHVAAPRREMGIRTVFNILGPMSNPAGVRRQVTGAFDDESAQKMIQVLKNTGSEHVLLLHSDDGLDEISLNAATHIHELKNGSVVDYRITPADCGFGTIPQQSIRGADPADNARIFAAVLDGQDGAPLEIAVFNAAAAIYVGGTADSIKEGVHIAKDAVKSGKALSKLQDLIEYTSALPAP
jgi:anthranilate phosphoribosyltransferase